MAVSPESHDQKARIASFLSNSESEEPQTDDAFGLGEKEASPVQGDNASDNNVDDPIMAQHQRLKGMVEAVLFVTGRPLHMADIAHILRQPLVDVEDALMALIQDYAFRQDSALEIDDSDGYILQVRPTFKPVLDAMVPMEITAAALQTLSAIAIKGPLLQSELVELRGAGVYDHIPELVTKKLVTKKRVGRSYRVSVTNQFHEYFRLEGDKKELAVMMSLIESQQASQQAKTKAVEPVEVPAP